MKTVRKKTYNNFLYIMNTIIKSKGYNQKEAEEITRELFDNESFKYRPTQAVLDNLITAEEHRRRVYMHNYNMEGIF